MNEVFAPLAFLSSVLEKHAFVVQSEATLQDAVCAVLEKHPSFKIEREVAARVGRYDILARVTTTIASFSCSYNVVIELKLHAAAPDVLRQVSKYAEMPDIDAIALVTTSRRLVAKMPYDRVIGVPFLPIALRAY